MRLRNVLDELLCSPAKMRVARVLAMDPRKDHTGRELALLAGVSQPQAGEALRVFQSYGAAKSRVAGRAILWEANHESAILREIIIPLFTAEKGVLQEVKREVCRTLKGVSERVVLFGSIARGGGGESSDLDICIVTKRKKAAEKAAKDLQASIARKYNIAVSPLIYSPAEYSKSKAVKEGEVLCGRG